MFEGIKKQLLIVALLFFAIALPNQVQAQDTEFDLVEDSRTILANLRVAPLTQNVCEVFRRYAAGEVLVRRIKQNPGLAGDLVTTSTEVESVQQEAANKLVGILGFKIENGFWPSQTESGSLSSCTYAEKGSRHLQMHPLHVGNRYEIVASLRRVMERHGFRLGTDPAPARRDVLSALRHQVHEDMVEVREQWETGEPGCTASLYVWLAMMKQGVPPSELFLGAEEAVRILECPHPAFYLW